MRARALAAVRQAPLARGRWMAALGAFLIAQAVALALTVRPTEAFGGVPAWRALAVYLPLLAATLAGLCLAGIGFPLAARGRRVARYRQRYLLALAALKQWFVEGRVAEDDFEAHRDRLRQAVEGRFPAELQRSAGDLLRRFGLALLGGALLLAAAAGRLWMLRDEPGAGIALAATAVGLLGCLGAGCALAAWGGPHWREGREATRLHIGRLEAEEATLLRAARMRASAGALDDADSAPTPPGVPSPPPPPPHL